MFTNTDFFDPDGDCVSQDFCAIGRKLLEQLGEFEMRFRSHTTRPGSTFHQESPAASRDIILDLQRHGRFSEGGDLRFELRLSFTDAGGQVTGLWPPDTP